MSTLSNEEINKYNDLYSQLISEFADLHNAHLSFIKYVGRDTGFETRKHLRSIANIADDLKRQGQKVCKESMANKRAELKNAKLEKARLKAIPKKRGPKPKGNKNDNNQ
jgi:hypothetical protein